MKKMTKSGKSGSQCQSRKVFGSPTIVPSPTDCAMTISERLSEPTHRRTAMMTNPIETS
jgi:hypothetical protein